MPISLLVPLIIQVGEPLALELLKMFEKDPQTPVTAADYASLKQKYGTKTAADYLAESKG